MKRIVLTLLFALCFFVWYELKEYQNRYFARLEMTRI